MQQIPYLVYNLTKESDNEKHTAHVTQTPATSVLWYQIHFEFKTDWPPWLSNCGVRKQRTCINSAPFSTILPFTILFMCVRSQCGQLLWRKSKYIVLWPANKFGLLEFAILFRMKMFKNELTYHHNHVGYKINSENKSRNFINGIISHRKISKKTTSSKGLH